MCHTGFIGLSGNGNKRDEAMTTQTAKARRSARRLKTDMTRCPALETRRAFSRGRHEPRARTLRQSIKYRPGFGQADELRDRGAVALPVRRAQEERDRRNTKKKDKREAERAARRGLHPEAEADKEERMEEN